MSEQELVQAYYGEHDRAHLAECEVCRAAFERIEAVLEQADTFSVPERGEGYGREVWARVAARLDEPRSHARFWRTWWTPRPWVAAGATAALVLVAFFLGRFWPYERGAEPAPKAITAQARERILMVAVGEHLDRSQMVLLELINAAPAREVDIAAEQQSAEDLVAANRLYRQTAERTGEEAIASVLDDLERALLEIARSPSRLSSDEFEALRRRIEAQGIVFKVRIIDSKLRTRSASS